MSACPVCLFNLANAPLEPWECWNCGATTGGSAAVPTPVVEGPEASQPEALPGWQKRTANATDLSSDVGVGGGGTPHE